MVGFAANETNAKILVRILLTFPWNFAVFSLKWMKQKMQKRSEISPRKYFAKNIFGKISHFEKIFSWKPRVLKLYFCIFSQSFCIFISRKFLILSQNRLELNFAKKRIILHFSRANEIRKNAKLLIFFASDSFVYYN